MSVTLRRALPLLAAGLFGAGVFNVGLFSTGLRAAEPSPPGKSLFIVELTYRRPLSEVDAALPAHVAFLDQHYRSGNFLMSGRKEPRTGGVILVRAESLDALSAILAKDPFGKAGIAEYRVTEFLPTKVAAALAAPLASAMPGN